MRYCQDNMISFSGYFSPIQRNCVTSVIKLCEELLVLRRKMQFRKKHEIIKKVAKVRQKKIKVLL